MYSQDSSLKSASGSKLQALGEVHPPCADSSPSSSKYRCCLHRSYKLVDLDIILLLEEVQTDKRNHKTLVSSSQLLDRSYKRMVMYIHQLMATSSVLLSSLWVVVSSLWVSTTVNLEDVTNSISVGVINTLTITVVVLVLWVSTFRVI